ncbi:hypothetical protein [Limobrevibacterium gyesilva]|uniref:Uncharacterized protein n=1 Tax=Limobrevibacterium gyesilva TaxID=2991712 RepID=A0AA41YNL4_9PROT|nr:hypothetical protein [Limobrevibacterium gyesilva]MCW3477224.1 hypothetical protein [Limobrevibacterium gyesilva]
MRTRVRRVIPEGAVTIIAMLISGGAHALDLALRQGPKDEIAEKAVERRPVDDWRRILGAPMASHPLLRGSRAAMLRKPST